MTIPIIIICYNNYKYVENMLLQISKINKEYYNNTIILNNKSTCLDTINFLNNVDVVVINNTKNNGPYIFDNNNTHIYNILPDKFILTDPDLKLNENIPNNFIEILSDLSDKYQASRIGFALDIFDYEKMYKTIYIQNKTIYEWEIRFWQNKINDNNDNSYELYKAPIDTTFSLVNKKYIYKNYDIRIAGNFTAKHIPWYTNNEIYNPYEIYILNFKNQTDFSTTRRTIISYIEDKYSKIYKNKEMFLIENNFNNPNLHFWKNIYSSWENDTFEIFDKYLSKDKIVIDIGGWIGTTAMYCSRKSKYVYSVEADKKSFNDMLINFKTNCINNYTLINKVIFNISDIKIKFGKNIFLPNSKMNDSTSQIYNDDITTDECYLSETITLENIIKNYQINPYEIGFIKVDIEGGEENILNDLFKIHQTYNISLYVSFHYTWWNDKNLDRFTFLTSEIKNKIIAEPFTSILF